MSNVYTLAQMTDKSTGLFKEISFKAGACILEEGFTNDKVFIIREGTCGLHRLVKRPNLMGKELMTKTKLATIEKGELVGESSLFRTSELDFQGISEVTVEVESLTCRLFYAKASDFNRAFPRLYDELVQAYKQKARQWYRQAKIMTKEQAHLVDT
jgi:CRP-like cAMP-binding protein